MTDTARLILASASKARQSMLRAAGLAFDAISAEIDEEAIRGAMQSESTCVDANDVARTLAEEKAVAVSKRYPDALVIGSDQVLGLGTRLFSKAATLHEARVVLHRLRGRTHELVSSVALAQDGDVLWTASESAQMAMRDFSDEFLATYLEHAGKGILDCVGCYEWEGLGVQLFEEIDGDCFTILGMPLLPLLAELRRRGVISA